MKTQSIFFLLIFLLIGITYCVKEDPSPETNIPPDSEEEALPPDKDSIDNPVPDSTSIEPQVTAQMGIVNCTGARVFFDIHNNGDHPVINKGVYWGTTENPTTANPDSTSISYTEEVNSAKGRFMSEIEQLQPATPYFVRAYVITRSDTIYSKDLSFTTNAPPTITTAEVTGITSTAAIAGGNVTTTGNSFVVERGICYSKAYNPVAYEDDPYIEQEVQSAEGTGEFSVTLTGLIPNTRYHVRSFVGVATGFSYGDQLIVYGDEVQFTTDALDSIDNPGQDPVTPGVVANLFSFNCTGALVFFNLVNADDNPVIDGGVYWGTTENPNTSNPGNSISYTEVWNTMDGKKGFRSQIDQLQPGTLYHIIAYITTTSDTYYSEDIWFITNPPPTIYTVEATEVTSTSAIVGGHVTSTGNSFVVERGICYSKNPNPVAYGIDPYIEQEVQSTEGMGVFTIPLEGLTPDTRYYVRSFVGVRTGVEYGDELFVYGDVVQFTTDAENSADDPTLDPVAPEVFVNIFHVNCTGAVVIFDITNDGQNPPVEGGIYLGTAENLTNTGPGNILCYTDAWRRGAGFRSLIDQLEPATLYFLRAYVTIASGTYYSKDLSFTTNPPPTITTSEVTEVASTTAIAGGNVTSNGNSFVVERGICYSTHHDPVAYENDPYIEQEVQSAEWTGKFTVTLAGLVPNTKYYVRSFVGVATGTSYGDQLFVYGDEVEFITQPL